MPCIIRKPCPAASNASSIGVLCSLYLCFRFVPHSEDGDEMKDWAVTPTVGDIGPGKTGRFRITFTPTQDNFYYSQEIEAYAMFKANRSFRLVDEVSLTPPWCLPVRCIGHSFFSTEQFLPKVRALLPVLYLRPPPSIASPLMLVSVNVAGENSFTRRKPASFAVFFL